MMPRAAGQTGLNDAVSVTEGLCVTECDPTSLLIDNVLLALREMLFVAVVDGDIEGVAARLWVMVFVAVVDGDVVGVVTTLIVCDLEGVNVMLPLSDVVGLCVSETKVVLEWLHVAVVV